MENEKVINFRNRIRVNKEDLAREERTKGKVVNFRLRENMKKRIEKLKTEYTVEQDIIGIASSEFFDKYNENIETVDYEQLEQLAKELLEELKKEDNEKGNER